MPISEVYNMDCMEYMKDIPDKFFDFRLVEQRLEKMAPILRWGPTWTVNLGGSMGQAVAHG